MNLTRNGRTRKGSLTLELVLVVPVLALILMGIIQYSSHLFALQAVQGAAMVGARALETSGATIGNVDTAVSNAFTLPYKNGYRNEDSNRLIIAKLVDNVYVQQTGLDTELGSGQYRIYVRISRDYAVLRGLNKYVMDGDNNKLKDYPSASTGYISAAYTVIK